MKASFFFLTLAIIALGSCQKGEIDNYDCSGIIHTYESTIKAIMDNNCVECHGGEKTEAGIKLVTYAQVKEAAAKDNFLGSIQHKSGYEKMPEKADQLSTEQIQNISCWVQNSTPEK